jgi:TrmH family RNA methyltransferase
MQQRGVEATLAALRAGEATAVLVQQDCKHEQVTTVRRLAAEQGVPVHEGTERDLWRMAVPGLEPPLALALVGRCPEVNGIDDLLTQPGPVVLLDGVKYATNVGFVVRTAEVAGASGVVLVSEDAPATSWLKDVTHASMGATRFMPLVHATREVTIEAVQRSGRPLIVAEDVGEVAPWDATIPWNAILAVGAESEGVHTSLLSAASAVVRIPMPGFVPSYNLQVAATALLMECLRQRTD